MSKDILIVFGARLKKIRKEMNITQVELAYRAQFDRNYIGMLERGERNPSLRSLSRLASACGMTLSTLLKFE